LGPTHHSLEDIAILRSLPEMTVMAPGDCLELRAALRAALKHDGPVYIRIGKKGEPNIHASMPELTIGKAINLQQGSDVCLIGTGVMMATVLDAARLLRERGISARVESFHTIKPLDTETLADIFHANKVVASVEEHGRIGGLGGAIAEWLAMPDAPRGKLITFATDDAFMHEVGSTQYARAKFGLTAENIVHRVSASLRFQARSVNAGCWRMRIGIDFDNTIVSYGRLVS
jgi:transketolase